MAKITKATLKSFVNKNRDKLYICVKWYFDGMIDGMSMGKGKFNKIKPDESTKLYNHTLDIAGCWLVGGGRDYFETYEDENFVGICAYNSCEDFILAIRK